MVIHKQYWKAVSLLYTQKLMAVGSTDVKDLKITPVKSTSFTSIMRKICKYSGPRAISALPAISRNIMKQPVETFSNSLDVYLRSVYNQPS